MRRSSGAFALAALIALLSCPSVAKSAAAGLRGLHIDDAYYAN